MISPAAPSVFWGWRGAGAQRKLGSHLATTFHFGAESTILNDRAMGAPMAEVLLEVIGEQLRRLADGQRNIEHTLNKTDH